MPKENDFDRSQLIAQLEQAHESLGTALSLLKKDKKKASSTATPTAAAKVKPQGLDFSTPLRAFVKKHGNGLSGPKKFTLLVAYLTEGDTAKQVSLADVEKQWNKMTAKGLLGMKFNRFYSSQAKDNDWVTTGKTGAYTLRPAWKEILGD